MSGSDHVTARDSGEAVRANALKQIRKQIRTIIWALGLCAFLVTAALLGWTVLLVRPQLSVYTPGQIFWPAFLMLGLVVWLYGILKNARLGRRTIQEGEIKTAEVFWTGYADLSGSYLTLRSKQGHTQLAALSAGSRREAWEEKTGAPFQAQAFISGAGAVVPRDFVVLYWLKRTYWGRFLPLENTLERIRERKKAFTRLMLALLLLAWGVLALLSWNTQEKINEQLALESLAKASLNWPTAQGGVSDARLRRITLDKGKISVAAWLVDVDYTYATAGRVFTGNTLSFCPDPARDQALAQARLTPLLSTRDVLVFHAPDNPESSVLEPGGAERCRKEAARQRAYFWLGPGLGLALTGLLIWAIVRKQRQFRRLSQLWAA